MKGIIMSNLRPMIVNQSELEWEGWEDPEIAAKSPIRWKLLITSERGPSSGLVTGIAEIPPGTSLLLHHHEPEETYYVISGNGLMQIDDYEEEIGPGSAIYIPPNAKHTVSCVGTEPLVFIFNFPRDSFDQVIYHYDA